MNPNNNSISTCFKCMKSTKSPIRLPCTHSICNECILNQAKSITSTTVKCPLRNCDQIIPECDLRKACPQDLIEKLHLNSIQQALKKNTKESVIWIGKLVACMNCKLQSHDVYFLNKCQHIVCRECIEKERVKCPIDKRLLNDKEQSILNISDGKERDRIEKLQSCKLVKCKEKIDCPICFCSKAGIRLISCLHEFCIECLQQHIFNCTSANLTCPDVNCNELISECEIRSLCGQSTLDKIHYNSLNKTVCKEGEMKLTCYSADCTGIAIISSTDQSILNFKCSLCNKNNCISCKDQHPINQSCEDFKWKQIDSKNEAKSKAQIDSLIKNGSAMKCPRCGILIEKTFGCDGMVCRVCQLEICWATKGPRWGPRGYGDISGGCKCSAMIRCSPHCKNCH